MDRLLHLYRLLLRLYPARFREEFAAPMEQHLRDECRSARGRRERLGVAVNLFADVLVSMPREVIREGCRDARFAVRVYARRPLVTVLALVSLSLAIGASTGVFSVVNGLLLRPLPFRAADRLTQLDGYGPAGLDSPSSWHDWVTQNGYFEDAIRYSSTEMSLAPKSGPARARVRETSANFFTMLGIVPTVGRGFVAGEDVPGRNTVAVLGDGLWRRAFGGDRKVIGTTIEVNGMPLTIVGVAPPRFDYPSGTAMWTPTIFELGHLPKAGVLFFDITGRLKPGVSAAQAQGLLEAEVRRLQPALLRREVGADDGAMPPAVVPLRAKLAGPARRASLAMLGFVTFVLLVAAANVAGLLMTRTTDRRRELLLRAALGATRARLLQQLVTEGVLLTMTACVCGLPVAMWTSMLAASAQPAQLATQSYGLLDWRVFAFSVVLAVGTGVFFGVLPAFVATREYPSAEGRRPRPVSSQARHRRVREGLVLVQVALALVLLAGALGIGRHFLALLQRNLGFRPERVVSLAVSLTGTRYDESRVSGGHYCREVLERLRAVPGVASAAAVDGLPLVMEGAAGTSYDVDTGRTVRLAVVNSASPDYFRTMGSPVLYGREFVPGDRLREPVALVNEPFAVASGLGGAIVGKRITAGWGGRPRTVVGVVHGLRHAGPAYAPTAQVFLQLDDRAAGTVWFVVRASDAAEAQPAVYRDAIQSVDRGVAVFNVMTLEERLSHTLGSTRFYVVTMLFFGGFALLLAGVGIYGVVSHAVAQRTHEIGVRIALGGAPQRVRRQVWATGLVPVIAGGAIGLIASLALGGLIQHLVVGAERAGAAAAAAAASLLIVTAAAAIGSATRCVVRLQPMDVLRSE